MMINSSDYSDTGPTCFQELFEQEYRRIRNRMMTYIFRYHLARYPKRFVALLVAERGLHAVGNEPTCI
jgi:hypothetical protein